MNKEGLNTTHILWFSIYPSNKHSRLPIKQCPMHTLTAFPNIPSSGILVYSKFESNLHNSTCPCVLRLGIARCRTWSGVMMWRIFRWSRFRWLRDGDGCRLWTRPMERKTGVRKFREKMRVETDLWSWKGHLVATCGRYGKTHTTS